VSTAGVWFMRWWLFIFIQARQHHFKWVRWLCKFIGLSPPNLRETIRSASIK
jgi:hypothetical protein